MRAVSGNADDTARPAAATTERKPRNTRNSRKSGRKPRIHATAGWSRSSARTAAREGDLGQKEAGQQNQSADAGMFLPRLFRHFVCCLQRVVSPKSQQVSARAIHCAARRSRTFATQIDEIGADREAAGAKCSSMSADVKGFTIDGLTPPRIPRDRHHRHALNLRKSLKSASSAYSPAFPINFGPVDDRAWFATPHRESGVQSWDHAHPAEVAGLRGRSDFTRPPVIPPSVS